MNIFFKTLQVSLNRKHSFKSILFLNELVLVSFVIYYAFKNPLEHFKLLITIALVINQIIIMRQELIKFQFSNNLRNSYPNPFSKGVFLLISRFLGFRKIQKKEKMAKDLTTNHFYTLADVNLLEMSSAHVIHSLIAGVLLMLLFVL